jgi:Leucine-rich repeat (LRR) protein
LLTPRLSWTFLHLFLTPLPAGNQLRAFPGWLPPSLTSLDLSKNQLVAVPVWVCGRLLSLRHLSIHANRVDTVPPELASLSLLR